MQFDLKAYTDAGEFVVFDPASIQSTGAPGEIDLIEAAKAAATAGHALIYSYGGDGEASFRILVNETPPAEWLRLRQFGVTGARLRVPSGRIMAAGAEYVWPQPHPDACTEATVPTGDYLVDAFDIDWEDKMLDEALRTRVSRWQIRLDNLSVSLFAIGMLGLFLGAGSMLWAGFAGSSTPLKAAGILLAVYWGAVAPLLIIARWRRVSERVEQARKEVRMTYPETVVWLRPITNERSFNVGTFGIEYAAADEEKFPPFFTIGCLWTTALTLIGCFVVALVIALIVDWVS